MFKPRTVSLLVLVTVLLAALASTVLAQGSGTVQVTNLPTYGQILTDSSGMTLYMFQKDTPGVSNCTGNCATTWPPLTVGTGVTATLASGVAGKLTTLNRPDGSVQVAFNDMPLYHYAQDQAAGDTKGQGVGGNWWVINPANGPVKTMPAGATAVPAAAATAAPPAALPTTGGNMPSGWLLLAAAGLVLCGLAVFGFGSSRRTG